MSRRGAGRRPFAVPDWPPPGRLELDGLRRVAFVREPVALVEVVVGDIAEAHLEVLAARLGGDRAVAEQDLAAALEQAARVARDAPDAAQVAAERQRLAEAYRELGGDAPDPGVGDRDGAADGLVEDRGGDAAVQAAGVALVLLAQREDAEEFGGAGPRPARARRSGR